MQRGLDRLAWMRLRSPRSVSSRIGATASWKGGGAVYRPLPEAAHTVGPKNLLIGDEDHAVVHGLRDQHAVEGAS